MMNASRAPVDLEALARDLRQEEARGQRAGSAKGDPLAELARIVGQDDPFRALLAARDEAHGAPSAPEAHLESTWRGRIEPSFAPEAAPKPTPADAFDQYLASVERDTHDEPFHDALDAHGDHDAVQDVAEPDYEEGRGLRRVKPRRRLASVGAGIAVVAVAITGALTYKALHGRSGGGVPVVQADTTPLKVAPKVADGVEIPDQNRQIYEPKVKGKDGQIRIVNREEQPLDVSEAARAAQGTGPAGAQGNGAGTTPGSGPFEAFGEPRRVRTVAVRPEAPPAPPPRDAQAEALPSVIPTMVLPSDQPPAASRPKPIRQVATTTQAAQTVRVQDAPPAMAAQPPAPRPVAVKPTPKAPQRVAAIAAETTAQDAPDTTAATDTGSAVSDAPVGGFSVQLGVRNSAGDARAALRQMQGKYGQLAGKPELIRQAEVNGKTIYRVRVGPLAKAEASSLCTALQGAGGQCFVAKN